MTRFAVYYGDSISLADATCPGCPPHHMSGTVSGGAEYVRLRLNRPPGIGGEITGESFHFREAWGYDVIAVFDEVEPGDAAVVSFLMTYVDFPPPNTEIIEVHVVRPSYQILPSIVPGRVEHGSYAEIRLYAGDNCAGSYPRPHTYTAAITSGGETGRLEDPRSGAWGQMLTGLYSAHDGLTSVLFRADGVDPDSAVAVGIRFTPSVSDLAPVETTLTVVPGPSCVLPVMVPDHLVVGDTARIMLYRMKMDSTRVLYPPGTLFTVALFDGMEAGTLFSPFVSDTGSYFEEVPQEGLSFIALRDIPEDSVSVMIYATQAASGNESASDKPSVRVPMADAARRAKLPPVRRNVEGGECNWGRGVVKQTISMVVYEPDDSTVSWTISAIPLMPKVELRAKIVGSSTGTAIFYWAVTMGWVNERDSPPRHFSYRASAQTVVAVRDTATWSIPWASTVIGGVVDTVLIASQVRSSLTQEQFLVPYRIQGMNPTVEAVKENRNLPEQVVIFMESYPKWCHFDVEGWPSFGPPHGYGLLQLDMPRATDEQVWHWKKNLEAGISLFYSKMAAAESYPSRIRDQAIRGLLPIAFKNARDFFTDEELLKETFQRYNGGRHWIWVPLSSNDPESPGVWRASPHSSGYGERAWRILQQVQLGSPPPGWD